VQVGNNYVLEIGTTRFHVRDRYVRRLQSVSDPKSEYEETCFCLPYTRVPTAEQIATALLALANNPALFDRWAAQIGAVKADGVRRGSACNENANQMHSGPARRRLPETHCCTHWS
jgi:hypothetical protein